MQTQIVTEVSQLYVVIFWICAFIVGGAVGIIASEFFGYFKERRKNVSEDKK